MRPRGTLNFLLVSVFAATVLVCAPAFGFDETTMTTPPPGDSCATCHNPGLTSVSGVRYGPHGGYLTTTSACQICHAVHDAPTSNALLPGATITATCLTCHDGTSALGEGIYGAIEGRGEVVGGGHSIDATTVVPGGNASSGGSSIGVFSGVGDTLTCSDCHSPHGSNCVAAFLGERQRSYRFLRDYHGRLTVQTQNRLLKQRPGNATTPTAEYGSDWCLGCHAGRASGLSGVHNHPTETTTPYNYRSLGIIAATTYPTSSTVLGPAGINTKSASAFNRAYLMPYPRSGAQVGHLPICQQCHEDTRFVGTLTADGTQATPSPATVASPDGLVESDNPRFQNFPHETTGYRLLVESTTTAYFDDLCLNCHPAAQLP
jgi:predicted CXXCH cytochrome family protein